MSASQWKLNAFQGVSNGLPNFFLVSVAIILIFMWEKENIDNRSNNAHRDEPPGQYTCRNKDDQNTPNNKS